DANEALERVVRLARYLRSSDPSSPVPYLLLRGLRWGELFACGSALDPTTLQPPTTETRQSIKNLARDGEWNNLLEASETAMGEASGRSWLDIQRYTVRACENLGYEAAAAAVKRELFGLLTCFPEMRSASLADDTPAANSETLAWIA